MSLVKCYFLTKGRRIVIKNVRDTVDRIKWEGGCYFPDPIAIHSSSTRNSPEIIFFDNNSLPLNKKNSEQKDRYISVKDMTGEVLDSYMADYVLEQNAGKSSKGGLGLPSMRTIAIIIFIGMVAYGVYNLWRTGDLNFA